MRFIIALVFLVSCMALWGTMGLFVGLVGAGIVLLTTTRKA